MQGNNEQMHQQQVVNRPVRPNTNNKNTSQKREIIRPNVNTNVHGINRPNVNRPNVNRPNVNRPNVNRPIRPNTVKQPTSDVNKNINKQNQNTISRPVRPTQNIERPIRPIRPNGLNANRNITNNTIQMPIKNENSTIQRSANNNIKITNKSETQTAKKVNRPINRSTITQDNTNTNIKQNGTTVKNVKERPIQTNSTNEKSNIQQTESTNKQEEFVLGQQTILDETDNKDKPHIKQLLHSKKEAKERILRLEQSQNEINKKNSIVQKDYNLVNNNKESFVVKQVKKPMKHFLIVPIAVVIVLLAILIFIGLSVFNGVRDINSKNSVSTLSSKTIDIEKFKTTMEQNGLQTEEKKQDNNIIEYLAYSEDMSYEVDFIEFESQEDAEAYFNYIRDNAGATESSKTSDITSKNGAESVFISKIYAGYMDITYIKNTIMIGIAYDSNKQDTVTKIMDDLGY